MKGRKQKPEHLKVLEGTFRKDRKNNDAPEKNQAPMTPPFWLPENCLCYFNVIKERMETHKLGSASWTEAAAALAIRIREIQDCNEIIAEQGSVYKSEIVSDKPEMNEQGVMHYPKKILIKGHPAVTQRSEALRHLQALLSEFGLTPASIGKTGVNLGNKKTKDPWENI